MAMDTATKVARQRLSVLELAERLGNKCDGGLPPARHGPHQLTGNKPLNKNI